MATASVVARPQSRPPGDRQYALFSRDLTKTFSGEGGDTRALDGVDVRVSPGQVTGLIGPDGAGKTTFMRLAAGLLVPDRGSIQVLGLDATRESLAVQCRIGYMPQRFGLYEDLTVQENLDLYADLQGVPATERPARYARTDGDDRSRRRSPGVWPGSSPAA